MGLVEYAAQEEAQRFPWLLDVHLREPAKPHTLVSSSTSICRMASLGRLLPPALFPFLK